jgi:hypothetical protein
LKICVNRRNLPMTNRGRGSGVRDQAVLGVLGISA